MKHLCTRCETAMRVLKNGVTVIEMFGEPPQPYRIWQADLYGCDCGNQVIAGFGKQPVAEHWQQGFTNTLTRYSEGEWVYRDYERRVVSA